MEKFTRSVAKSVKTCSKKREKDFAQVVDNHKDTKEK